MYKLIAIDLDGTLLNSYGEVSKKNREAIKYAIDKGVEVVLASGRDPQTMKKISCDLGIKKFLIAGNGSNIYDIKNERNIYENFIEKQKALEIIKICKNNSIFLNVYTDNGIITETIDYNVKVFNNENNNKPNDKRTNIQIVKDLYTQIEENDFKILKIIICDENKIIFNNIIEKMKNLKNVEVLEVEHMSKKVIKVGTEEHKIEYYYTEVTNKNANKWEAVKFISKQIGVSESEIICIGDNMNDFEMVKNAGLGVAMKDSALEKKNIADEITENNDDDGVGNAIFRHI